MADYLKIREKRIQENKLKMNELGVTSMAYKMTQMMKGSKQTKKGEKVTKDNDEYTPDDEEGELNHSSEEDENQIRKKIVNLRSRSKKVVFFSLTAYLFFD